MDAALRAGARAAGAEAAGGTRTQAAGTGAAGAGAAASTKTAPGAMGAGTRAAAPQAPRIGLVTFELRFGSHRAAQHGESAAQHGESSAAALLLDDAADALVAYTRMAAREAGLDKAAIPEFIRTNIRPGYDAEPTDGRASVGARPLSQPCDALACAIDAPTEAQQTHDLEEALATACALATEGARVYAIVAVCGAEAGDGEQALRHAARICARTGRRWSGGLVVTDAELIPRLMRAPRLGAWRRPVSEAIDTLVVAVRLNCSLSAVDDLLEGRAASGDSAGYLIASPNRLWRSVARLLK